MFSRARRRGRPPKSGNVEKSRHLNILKKPRYLLDSKDHSDTSNSQVLSPFSRNSSPIGSDVSRKSRTKKKTKTKPKAKPAKNKSYYSDNVEDKYSDYHYGSDFGEEDSDKSDNNDSLGTSDLDENREELSDSDFSVSSYSTTGGNNRKNITYQRNPTPEPLWLQNRDIPPLELPKTSDDLLVPREHVMTALSIYEVLRRFRTLIRLSPFRFEDFCAVLTCEEQTYLFAEIHIMLLKAILREEDAQQTHFGALDQKDSVNSVLYFIDGVTWPEVLRAYIESDGTFEEPILQILNSCEYPFTDIENRLKILQFLINQFLITNPVREDLIHEGGFQYEDHCRVCHKVGDLLCCETCPAVFHLECVDPPLTDVPTEDWQCNLCKIHKVTGVTDCIPDIEKSGLLSRQEPLGFDRHGRKYWFLCRRIFIESEDGEYWYYSSVPQLDELLETLDSQEYEAGLCREINEFREEIIRQMTITEKLTMQSKGSKKSFLEVENAALSKLQKERLEKRIQEEEQKRQKGKKDDDSSSQGGDDDVTADGNGDSKDNEKPDSGENADKAHGKGDDKDEKMDVSENDEDEEDLDDEDDEDGSSETKKQRKRDIVTRSKTGSLTPRTYNMEELRKKDKPITPKVEAGKANEKREKEYPDIHEINGSRLTRLKAQQISTGTYLFKLGMENSYKNYTNQYSMNQIALNKFQKSEERDKKRHMSYKFSLTTAAEFKWPGNIYSNRSQLVNSLRQSVLQMENSIPPAFMHVNWSQMRKAWIAAVNSSNTPREFARAIIALHACIKPVVFASVWHDQLGHTKLIRITAAEREEKKRLDKKEKKEYAEEEERNRMTYNFVKYTLGLKHQVYKQKGEEYRIHGQWGWLWLASTRRVKIADSRDLGLSSGPYKYMVQVKDEKGFKILAVEERIYEILMKQCNNEGKEDMEVDESDKKESSVLANLKNLKVIPPKTEFTEIDVSKSLLTPGRLHYPKVAKKSKLDELLTRRTHLKALEERQLAAKKAAAATPSTSTATTTTQPSQASTTTTTATATPATATDKPAPSIANPTNNNALFNALTVKIHALRSQYISLTQLNKTYVCYSRGCANQKPLECYSPLCRKRSRLRVELLELLHKASALNQANKENKATPETNVKKIIKTEEEAKPTTSVNSAVTNIADIKISTTETESAVVKTETVPASAEVKIEAPEQQQQQQETPPQPQPEPEQQQVQIKEENQNSSSFAATAEGVKIENAEPVASATDDVNSATTTAEESQPVASANNDNPTTETPLVGDNNDTVVANQPTNTVNQTEPLQTETSVPQNEEKPADTNGENTTVKVEIKNECIDIKTEHESFDQVAQPSYPSFFANATDICNEVEIGANEEVEESMSESGSDQSDDESKKKKTETEKTIKQEQVEEKSDAGAAPSKSTADAENTKNERTIKTLPPKSSSSAVPDTAVNTTTTTLSSRGKSAFYAKRHNIKSSIVKLEPLSLGGRNTRTVSALPNIMSTPIVAPRSNLDDMKYSTTDTKQKIYLKKIQNQVIDKRKKRSPVKYPQTSTFATRANKHSIMILAPYELRKLARKAGRFYVSGFSYLAKANHRVWNYPCPRPLFKTSWLYRAVNVHTILAAGLHFRIMWASLKWDDMQTKHSLDMKNQVTNETEIITTEILEKKHLGPFCERTEYKLRKIVTPLETPKTIREVTSFRTGLRKRKREEALDKVDPQISEVWVDESKLELWEIKQFAEKLEKEALVAQTQSMLRPRPLVNTVNRNSIAGTPDSKDGLLQKTSNTSDDVKERVQRIMSQNRKALDAANTPTPNAKSILQPSGEGNVIRKFITSTPFNSSNSQVLNLLSKSGTLTPGTPNSTFTKENSRFLITTGNGTPVNADKTMVGARRIFMAKGPDGKATVITSAAGNILPKLIQQKGQVAVSQASTPTVTQDVSQNAANAAANNAITKLRGNPVQQRIQISKTPDGKFQVKGLLPGQQLVQLPGGKLHVLHTQQSGGVTSTSLAGNAVLKKIDGEPNAPTGVVQQVAIANTVASANEENLAGIITSDANTQQPKQQIAVLAQNVNNAALKSFLPVSKLQMSPMVGGAKTTQVILKSQPGMQTLIPKTSGNTTVLVNNSGQVVNPQQIVIGGKNIATQASVAVTPTLQTIATPKQTSVVLTSEGQMVNTMSPLLLNSANMNTVNVLQNLVNGKAALTTINGQQVIIRAAGGDGTLAQLATTPGGAANIVKVVRSAAPGTISNLNIQTTTATSILQNQPPLTPIAAAVAPAAPTSVVTHQQAPITTTTIQSPTKLTPKTQVTKTILAPKPKKISPAVATAPTSAAAAPVTSNIGPGGDAASRTNASGLTPQQEAMLANEPPGTIIKCITAQVIQSPQGPRIVLQGLQGSNFTPQQLQVIQHQVKQQLLKTQASAGNQGILGPTKIYLAMQQAPGAGDASIKENNASQPESSFKQEVNNVLDSLPPIAPKQPVNPTIMPQQQTMPALNETLINKTEGSLLENHLLSSPADQTRPSGTDTSAETISPAGEGKVGGRKRPSSSSVDEETPAKKGRRAKTPKATPVEKTNNKARLSKIQEEKKWNQTQHKLQNLLYRQKEQLKKEILQKRDILEKELKMQIQKEIHAQNKQIDQYTTSSTSSSSVQNQSNLSSMANAKRKMTAGVAGSSASPSNSVSQAVRTGANVTYTTTPTAANAGVPTTPSNARNLLQMTLSNRTGVPGVVSSGHTTSSGRTVTPTAAAAAAAAAASGRLSQAASSQHVSAAASTNMRKTTAQTAAKTPNRRAGKRDSRGGAGKQQSLIGTVTTSRSKKEKLLCVCRTPYDDTKFYVGCDLCNNWFHGDCVGITEEMSKSLSEFVCLECAHARESQELYCLCRQPYDESQFYICCDRCQDWFHGRCVGILQSEADHIDEYICPNCTNNSNANVANTKNLTLKDYEALRKLIKQIQLHKSAWPFMEPVDPEEAPDYYNVVKEPMDLTTIELRVTDRKYKKLSEFIGDMTKIFDNCRYYNPKDSPFYKCAEALESYFVSKVKGLRDRLTEAK
ncbi:nucleosome-remodeling factor subunit NURF301 [Planococcus citri]|uniref:nucleosome-remodeling factor subunit NURF301 n=1 Tax=Planococcus citri TaxID=170843 RepID=UPI0031F81A51